MNESMFVFCSRQAAGLYQILQFSSTKNTSETRCLRASADCASGYEEPQTVDGSSTMAACAWWPERRCKSPKKGGAGYDSGDSPQSP